MLYDHIGTNAQGHLTISGYDAVELAAEYGTPLIVLDEGIIRRRCQIYRAAMARSMPAGSKPFYASKAFSCKRLCALAAQEGLGLDVVSAGELYTAQKAGFPMAEVCFHGSNKTDFEIGMAMDCGVGTFVCDSADELEAIEAAAARRDLQQRVLLRLTPGIDPHTHEKINTGRIDSKFGAAIETGQAEDLLRRALSCAHVAVAGYHCHIGSQIFDEKPFCDAAVLMLSFAAEMGKKLGYFPAILDLGGGMAVPYVESDPKIDYAANIEAVGQLVAHTCRELGLTVPSVWMEPGRSLVADAGVALYTVGATKEIPGFKNYVSIDGGMADNPRYALYQAPYTVCLASRMGETPTGRYTVAGRCCESGDLIQEDVPLPRPKRGDLLAVLTAGAYQYSMASNYNRVPRPAVLMLGENGPCLAIRRESLDDLLLNDL